MTTEPYSNVLLTVDRLWVAADFDKAKAILAYTPGDPLLIAVYEDDEQACIAFHFSGEPPLADRDETLHWRLAELRNASAWMHQRSDQQIGELRKAGFAIRLTIHVTGPDPGFSSFFYVPPEIVSEASRFQLGLSLFIGPPSSPDVPR